MGDISSVSVEAFVGVGSNVDPEEHILAALSLLRSRVQVVATSAFYRNPALSPDRRELPPFVNGVLKIATDLAPSELKYDVLRKIEKRVQRTRTGDRYEPRTLDLDLLVYGDLEIESEGLTLPDPDIAVQPFWIVPLADLIPDFLPPGACASMEEMSAGLDTRAFVCLEALTAEVRSSLGISGSPRLPV